MLDVGLVPSWHLDAACAEHEDHADDWFPETGQSMKAAKAICNACLVQRECLVWALEQGPQLPGLWGGASARERKELLKSEKITPGLVARWGSFAMQGREYERDRAYDAEREREVDEALGIAG